MFRVLVADQDSEYRALASRVLSDARYRVFDAADEEEVIRAVWEHLPDLLVVDVRLPPHGGIGAVERIRESAWALPFILTSESAFCDEGFRVWYADACVRKSGDALELRRAVRRILGPSRSGLQTPGNGTEVIR